MKETTENGWEHLSVFYDIENRFLYRKNTPKEYTLARRRNLPQAIFLGTRVPFTELYVHSVL